MESSLLNWSDLEIVTLSAIQHYSYCPRQCALIHMEQTFEENIYTVKGDLVHENVKDVHSSTKTGIHIEHALPLWSERLGIVGIADVVEFPAGIPYPVEYKHGRKIERLADELQLCAQAICLEEMTGEQVPRGAIYHYSSRKRREVTITDKLRFQVEEAVIAIRDLLRGSTLPKPVNDNRCRYCSLIDACLPKAITNQDRLHRLTQELYQNDN